MDPSKILERAFHDALKVTACVLVTAVLLFVIATTCFAQGAQGAPSKASGTSVSSPRTAMSQSTPVIYTPTYIASSGAYGTNAAWEAGYAPYWYPELQRYGADFIEAGIAQENPALISQGLTMLDWGFAHMGSDGSFPGCTATPVTPANVNSALGDNFHSVSLFLEGASRAVLDLRAYHPVTYVLDPSTYSAKLASYSTNLALIAAWMTNTNWAVGGSAKIVNVPQLGFTYDQYYGHRYYLLAAALQECSVVTNNPSLITEPYGVNWWIDQGFPRQLGAGWQAAIPAATVAGTSNTPATLLAPGSAPPPNTTVISAAGVNPERGGYDASYQMVGCLHASRFYNASSDAVRKAQVSAMLVSALQWERSRQSVDGTIDTTGGTRVDVDGELQDPSVKKGLNSVESIEAFEEGGAIDGKGRDALGGVRLQDLGTLPSSDPIAASGAIGTNSAYDTNHSASYNIGLQKDCADWVQAGILHENPAQIHQGLAILNWGLARQAADGSFPGDVSPYTDGCTFIEAAARTVLMLQNYSANHLYPVDPTVLTGIPATIAAIQNAGAYLGNSTLISHYASTTSASRLFTYAAALNEGSVCVSPSNPSAGAAMLALSQTFLTQALLLQLTDGTDGESGVFSGNPQLTSIRMGERLCLYGNLDAPTKATLTASITAALRRMEQVIDIDGNLLYPSASTSAAQGAFQDGFAVTANPEFEVIYQRLISSLTVTIGQSGGGGGIQGMLSADLGIEAQQPVFDIEAGTTVCEAGSETYLHIPMSAANAADQSAFDLTQGPVEIAVIEFGQVVGSWQAGDWLIRTTTPIGTFARLLMPGTPAGVYRAYVQTQGYSVAADGTIQFV